MVEGAPHTAKRSKGSIVVVSRGAPLPPYIKEQGGGGGRPRRGRAKGSPTPTGSRTPPGAPSLAGRTPPFDPLYTEAGGTPRHTS